ncbi:unnamed protein product [Durusdinium trenchii]|uniref:Uncharacterized protein n=1 Tax=Durusdinium trenchii TaxID=1381693 RepID=A0ABP0RMW4_9DINO
MASKKEICPLVWYRRARLLLGLAAVVLTGLDNYLWCWNQAPRWLLGTLVLLTGWGWGDAVLRFPLIHDIDSFFTIKQVVLTVGKPELDAASVAKLLPTPEVPESQKYKDLALCLRLQSYSCIVK